MRSYVQLERSSNHYGEVYTRGFCGGFCGGVIKLFFNKKKTKRRSLTSGCGKHTQTYETRQTHGQSKCFYDDDRALCHDVDTTDPHD